MNMNNESFENLNKLEQIEASAIENSDEIMPLEYNLELTDVATEQVEALAQSEEINHNVEMSSCRCTGGCGSGYSMTNNCRCTGGCGSSYHM